MHAGAALALWLWLSGGVAAAPPAGSDDGARVDDLAALRARIVVLEGRLASLSEEGKDLEEQFLRSGLVLGLQEARVAEAQAARDQAKAALDDVVLRAEGLSRQLAQRRLELRQRLRFLRRLGDQGYLGLLLALEDGAHTLEAVRLVRQLVRRDARAIAAFRASARELEATRSERRAREQEVAAWLRQEEERRAGLRAASERERELLRALEGERGAGAALAIALRDQAQRLAELIDALEAPGSEGLAAEPIERFRGVLDRPVAGEVVVAFGPRRDPRYGTIVPNNGIELQCAGGGAPVTSVYPGRVLYAAPFDGFGYTVVVQHSTRALTLYAGLSELLVHTGDMLDLTVIGRCAERVYFELRYDNRPQDPLLWLR